MKRLFPLVAACIASASLAWADPQGVSDDTIVLGSLGDLSGPLALGGVPSVDGMRLRFDAANAAGGVHGRKIDLRVEDMKYDLTQAVRAANKLVQRDRVFALIGTIGTPPSMAAMQILDKAGIPHLFPVTGASIAAEPLHPLHYSLYLDYQDQASGAVKYFVEHEGVKKLCLQAASNDYGQEVVTGVEQAAAALGAEIVLRGSHKVTETDFAGAATAIKNSDCDLLVLGTTIKDTIAVYATLRKLGWDKPVVGNMVPYLPLVAEAGDGVTEGLYLVTPYKIADFTDGDPFRSKFVEEYRAAYGREPNVYAQNGWIAAELTLQALEAAGRDLTVESFVKGIEQISQYDDPFDGPDFSFSETKHSGGTALVLVQSQGKAWTVLQENLPY